MDPEMNDILILSPSAILLRQMLSSNRCYQQQGSGKDDVYFLPRTMTFEGATDDALKRP